VQNEYLREVRRVGGKLANVEIETVGTAVKDPWKETQQRSKDPACLSVTKKRDALRCIALSFCTAMVRTLKLP